MSAAEPFFATRLPRLVMFDLDGTLVDSVPDLTAAVDSMLASLGRRRASRRSASGSVTAHASWCVAPWRGASSTTASVRKKPKPR